MADFVDAVVHRPSGGGKSTQAADMAKASGITREALHKALRPAAQPCFDTVSRVCAASGVMLVVCRPVHA